MKVKKKIAVWCALFALLVALVPPCSAKANTTETEEDGVLVDACLALKEDAEIYAKLKSYPYVLGKTSELSCDYMLMIYTEDKNPCVTVKGMYEYSAYFLAGFKSDGTRSYGSCYKYVDGAWEYVGYTNRSFKGSGSTYPEILLSSFDIIYDKSGNVLYEDIKTFFDYVDGYNFGTWCKDAGLNCQASSNESASVIPYSYNDYWHIVRKTNSGKWLLTTIGSTLGQAKMSLRLSENNGSLVINEFSGDDSFTLSVRQYEYDTDGWKVRSYDTYDYDDMTSGLLTLEAGTGIDDTRVIAYTSTDIYSSDGLAVVVSASTEYTEPTTPEVPSEEITPTPTTAPSGDTNDRNPTPDRTETDVDLGVDMDDITLDEIPEVIKNIKDSVKEFFGLVGVVPLMIGAVFGFLPDWCIWVLGVSFAFVGVLLVIKLIRG